MRARPASSGGVVGSYSQIKARDDVRRMLESEGVGGDAVAKQNLERRLQAAMSDWVGRHPLQTAPEPVGIAAPSYSRTECEARVSGLVARPKDVSVSAVRRAAGRGMTKLKYQNRGREDEVFHASCMARPSTHIPADAAARAALQHAARNDHIGSRLDEQLQSTVRKLCERVETAALDRRAKVLEVSRRELLSEPMPSISTSAEAPRQETTNKLRYTAQQMAVRLDHDAQRRYHALENLKIDLGSAEEGCKAPALAGQLPPHSPQTVYSGVDLKAEVEESIEMNKSRNEARGLSVGDPQAAVPATGQGQIRRYDLAVPPSSPSVPSGPDLDRGETSEAVEPVQWQETVHSIRKVRSQQPRLDTITPAVSVASSTRRVNESSLVKKREAKSSQLASRLHPSNVASSPAPEASARSGSAVSAQPPEERLSFEEWKARKAFSAAREPDFVVGSREVWENLSRAQKDLNRMQFQLDSSYTRYQNDLLSSSGKDAVYSERSKLNSQLWDPAEPRVGQEAEEAEGALSARMWALGEGTRRLTLRRQGLGPLPSQKVPKAEHGNIRTAGLLIRPSPTGFGEGA